jgi:hypothetical protein
VVAVSATQILAPLIQNKPLFVSFRKSYQREKWLKQQLEETKRRLAELELEKQLAECICIYDRCTTLWARSCTV